MKSLIRTVALATALAAVALVPVAGAQSNNWQRHNGYQNHYNNRANNSYRGDRYYRSRPYYRHNDNGAALGLLGGLAAGAIIGGVIAGQPRTQAWYDYCARTYRSFNPQTGTYRGYDGRDHPCVAR